MQVTHKSVRACHSTKRRFRFLLCYGCRKCRVQSALELTAKLSERGGAFERRDAPTRLALSAKTWNLFSKGTSRSVSAGAPAAEAEKTDVQPRRRMRQRVAVIRLRNSEANLVSSVEPVKPFHPVLEMAGCFEPPLLLLAEALSLPRHSPARSHAKRCRLKTSGLVPCQRLHGEKD